MSYGVREFIFSLSVASLSSSVKLSPVVAIVVIVIFIIIIFLASCEAITVAIFRQTFHLWPLTPNSLHRPVAYRGKCYLSKIFIQVCPQLLWKVVVLEVGELALVARKLFRGCKPVESRSSFCKQWPALHLLHSFRHLPRLPPCLWGDASIVLPSGKENGRSQSLIETSGSETAICSPFERWQSQDVCDVDAPPATDLSN